MISLLLINYRSSILAVQAIRSARAATAGDLEVVVVDNSCDAAEAESLEGHADTVLVAERNLGYAAGINRGRPACRGEVLVVANPDVVFGPRAIDELAAALAASGAAVAGPALSWDTRGEWMLPPADLVTAAEKLDEALSSRVSLWSAWRDRRRFRSRLRFWLLSETTAVRAISGAVMAIRAGIFDSLGGFDERFPLYFEETDFLRRVAGRGGRIVYVPSARCRHLFNQSAGGEPSRSASLFVESERRYLEKWSGVAMARLLKSIERPPRTLPPLELSGPVELDSGDLVVEASPLPSFTTAAGHFPASNAVTLPDEVWSTYRGDRLFLRVVDRHTGRVRGTYVRRRS